MQGWELHRPSTRPSSSNMLIVAAPAALPAGSPPPAGSGWFRRKQAPISPWVLGLLCGFWRELFAVGSADLGKRCIL